MRYRACLVYVTRRSTRLFVRCKYSVFFFSSRRRHTRLQGDWSSDVCSSDLMIRHTRLQGDWSSDVCSSDLLVTRPNSTPPGVYSCLTRRAFGSTLYETPSFDARVRRTDMNSENQKTIFITGSSSGLGRAAAKLFALRGWKVIATMRNPDIEKELTIIPGVTLMALDTTDPQQIQSVAEQVVASDGVDVVFNNAGYGLAGPLEGLSDEQVLRMVDTNMLGPIRTTKA